MFYTPAYVHSVKCCSVATSETAADPAISSPKMSMQIMKCALHIDLSIPDLQLDRAEQPKAHHIRVLRATRRAQDRQRVRVSAIGRARPARAAFQINFRQCFPRAAEPRSSASSFSSRLCATPLLRTIQALSMEAHPVDVRLPPPVPHPDYPTSSAASTTSRAPSQRRQTPAHESKETPDAVTGQYTSRHGIRRPAAGAVPALASHCRADSPGTCI